MARKVLEIEAGGKIYLRSTITYGDHAVSSLQSSEMAEREDPRRVRFPATYHRRGTRKIGLDWMDASGCKSAAYNVNWPVREKLSRGAQPFILKVMPVTYVQTLVAVGHWATPSNLKLHCDLSQPKMTNFGWFYRRSALSAPCRDVLSNRRIIFAEVSLRLSRSDFGTVVDRPDNLALTKFFGMQELLLRAQTLSITLLTQQALRQAVPPTSP
ncbi:hypothetical protein SCHPADRAFT_888431 [Schizopora paradoxa]|uniref:Uncharacterized protein n=1 Tax=Schizopora paradoxa TaxID=27342 RepID=A0A0H2RVA0_9AGAM|nr:hypothetical protein SCHPADRAFT_888431 [Schizopora paradoxa]